MLLARTDPDSSKSHRGLSLFVVPKPRADGKGFAITQDTAGRRHRRAGGRIEGRPIDTIGYRGMHSYELAFENWFVPSDCLIGGPEGEGRGFYLQMRGFENGRLQTAARALGVMQAAYEAARTTPPNARSSSVHPIADYQLTRAKLARMALRHPGDSAVHLRGRPADGEERRLPGGVHGEGIRLPRRRVGDA